MGISGVSIGSLLIVLVIVMLLFGTKRLRTVGGDLGGALRGFREAIKESDSAASKPLVDYLQQSDEADKSVNVHR